jgi:hypothetical protein
MQEHLNEDQYHEIHVAMEFFLDLCDFVQDFFLCELRRTNLQQILSAQSYVNTQLPQKLDSVFERHVVGSQPKSASRKKTS